MTKWEYMLLESSANYGTTKFYVNGEMQPALKNQPLHEIINQLGWQGWEMVGLTTDGEQKTYIFKRQTEKPPVIKKQTTA